MWPKEAAEAEFEEVGSELNDVQLSPTPDSEGMPYGEQSQLGPGSNAKSTFRL